MKWLVPPDNARIDSHTVDIWFFSVVDKDIPDILTKVLSPAEHEQARRFRTGKLANSFMACRGMVRFILGWYCSIKPSDVSFMFNRYGKPCLDGKDGFEFNLSHSGSHAVLAITKKTPLGVDIEEVSSRLNWREIATGEFTSREREILQATPPEKQRALFFTFWTRKEALLKGVGRGLSVPLNQIDISDIDSPRGFFQDASLNSENGRWTLRDIAAYEGYKAAYAVQGQDMSVRQYETTIHNFIARYGV
jgi:4'-phosphopantetheinyl transferase